MFRSSATRNQLEKYALSAPEGQKLRRETCVSVKVKCTWKEVFQEVCSFHWAVHEADGPRLGTVLSLEDWSEGGSRLRRGGLL